MKFYDKQPPTGLRGDNLVKWERQKLNVNQTLSNLSHEKTIKLKEIGRLRDTIKEEKGFLEWQNIGSESSAGTESSRDTG